MDGSDSRFPYRQLGIRIAEARSERLMTQGGLAKAIDVTQQSVSRWEAGTHRPSAGQIPTLAGALHLKADEVRTLAGYAASAAPRAPYLPLESLAPDMFERFVSDLLAIQHPEAQVRQEGSRGHDQSGIDIRVIFDDRQWVVQCKQARQFGPAETARAIEAVEVNAERKILALSRIATPQAAAVIRSAPGWRLWDLDDLSRMVRALAGADQDRLIDSFFPGQRMALLGRRESGPWLTKDQFFAPFAKAGAVFNHQWDLQGRDSELAALEALLAGDDRVGLLVAVGGMGKSRLLRAGLDAFAAKSPRTTIWMLSATRDPTRESLESLGSSPKLLVVDDAHDREGLAVVVEYVADDTNNARLLLATRPYALQRLRNDLTRYGFNQPPQIDLERLPRTALQAIVSEVLESNGASGSWAEVVAGIAGDNPLIATMAARVIADGDLSLAEVRSHDAMRDVVLARFADVITGGIGETGDGQILRSMLELVAVMQPVHLNDRRLGELFEATTGIPQAQASRALRILIKGGVVYRRADAYRLMPDVLGDYLIDESCIQPDGKLTAFAEKIIDSVAREQLTQVMVNLGRLDWRRNQGDPSNSDLLDRAWARLDDVEHSWDPRFGAIRSVAMFQPRQALDFVHRHLRDDDLVRDLTPILRNIAFTPEYRIPVCRLLWEMGRDDDRALGQNPNHPIRVLAELCAFGEYKPIEISEEVADFAFDLMASEQAWRHHYSPLDIVEKLLDGVIEANRDTGRAISFGRYFLNYDFALPLRQRTIDCVLDLLSSPDPTIAVRAANQVDDAVRLPMGMGSQAPSDELRARYQTEFRATMKRLLALVSGGGLSAATVITIAQSIEWHARYNTGSLATTARRILAALPDTLEFRLRASLVEGAQRAFRGQIDYEEWSPDNPWRDALVEELKQIYPDYSELLTTIEDAMNELHAARLQTGAAFMLVSRLVEDDLPMAHTVLDRAREPHSIWAQFEFNAVREILERDPETGRAIIAAALDASDDNVQSAVRSVSALGSLRRELEAADVALLRRAIASRHETIVVTGLNSTQWTHSLSDETILELLLLAPLELGAYVLGAVAHLLEDRNRKLIGKLSAHDVAFLLGRLRNVKSLGEGHWIEQLFKYWAAHFPVPFARFLLDRADDALATDETAIDLLGHRFSDGGMGFDKSPDADVVLELGWNWLVGHAHDDGWVIYRVVDTFASLFDINARVVVDFFDARLDTASPIELRLLGRVLRHTHHFFAFAEQAFVERVFDRVAQADPDELEHVRDSLAAAAVSGMKSGVRGEPMPRDLEAKQKAEIVLAQLSRFSPAFPLYEEILKDAERDIARAVREGKMLDELE